MTDVSTNYAVVIFRVKVTTIIIIIIIIIIITAAFDGSMALLLLSSLGFQSTLLKLKQNTLFGLTFCCLIRVLHVLNESGIILCWFPGDADEVAVDSVTLLVLVVCRAEHDAETSLPLGQHEGPLSVQTSVVHVVITPKGGKGKATFRLIILGAFR